MKNHKIAAKNALFSSKISAKILKIHLTTQKLHYFA